MLCLNLEKLWEKGKNDSKNFCRFTLHEIGKCMSALKP